MAQGGACTHGRSLLCEAGAVHRRASFAYVPNAMPQSVLLSQVTGEALDEEGLDQGLDQALDHDAARATAAATSPMSTRRPARRCGGPSLTGVRVLDFRCGEGCLGLLFQIW